MLQSRTQFGPVEGERRNVTEDGEESPEHSTIKLRVNITIIVPTVHELMFAGPWLIGLVKKLWLVTASMH